MKRADVGSSFGGARAAQITNFINATTTHCEGFLVVAAWTQNLDGHAGCHGSCCNDG